ncbi:MAG: 23S rRNA (adenine(2503)-C(2))-methyltransferase RlmN [Candidatus Cloacimonetes bacterium HGW-Cloacimonetes-3]|jgi:23S rRNA (adenine2503-C2)-methyltransferase|nr:MAG: 23S rRNA (adenine(2503)-C(2))-methyltransferase RlmN [Candidatus Cloacimonetes bacterium HGW-Cloacimonetes-3]
MLTNIFSLLPDELSNKLTESFPKYRSKQLLDWIYKHLVFAPEQMTNLPSDFKAFLAENYSFAMPETVSKLVSKDGSAKYRHRLYDGELVESVLIPEGNKNTLCISSQVGCSRKCSFCATGKMGLTRNLSTDEIVTQILIGSHECTSASTSQQTNKDNHLTTGSRLTNLVFMGMGEPLDNLDNLIETLKIIQADNSLTFSPRRTTVSTCGVVPGIVKFADSGVRAKLAISLNSAIDAKRDALMPINRQYPLHELKQALLYYLRKSSFRVTIEYVLIAGENMGREDLNALRKFVGDISCKINFIPFNPGTGATGLQAPDKQQVDEFMRAAATLPQAIMLRKSRGADVFGACGQLRINKTLEK